MDRLLTCVATLVVLAVAFLACPENAGAEQARPPWLSDEVVAAAVAIELDTEQLPAFRTSAGEFLNRYGEEVRRLIRRNEPDLQIHIDRKREKLARDMDERMAAFMSDEQLIRYQDYRKALLEALSRR